MMKHVTLDAPRSTAATTGVRTRAAFRPSFLSSVRGAILSIRVRISSSGAGGRRRPGRIDLAWPDGHQLGIAQVDAVEAELEDVRALVQLLEPHQGVFFGR